ncbi:MAG: hypothetical protein AUJ52_02190 [Elusimicrobia bacterium CG1_02_63_36]|nr:MAG: hypothetical protein AUJ52_02190 [Elusimicrobia bacterium CG1_02_63_36]PIP84150.1 MAG: hypothetical protein COR54_05715 [Elusimicrobia bacterium CG22_combo_CG10-13_8_21_14_all_63_91]PJA16428.1 MAG: hypothetical protein COX66_07480 [Elusimicrobia bacterium CG_4_10_14_0_2_um_filter_63_34]PJB25696.1 MAG: hypothetical protein CO113_07365 [Elusimicrobia bacterium CG_4_9_14_3_um_filter_62_55]
MPLSHFHRPLVLIAFAAALAVAALRRPILSVEPPPRLTAFARIPTTTIEARIVSHSSPKHGGERFWVDSDRTGSREHAPLRVLAYLPRRDPTTRTLRPGMKVRLTGRLRLPMRPRGDGGFDEQGFLARRGAVFVMHAKHVEISTASIPARWRPRAWGETAHRDLQAFLAAHFSPYAAAVYEGLLLGFRGRMKPAESRAIQNAGVMHLLTPSGAKVTAVWAAALALGALFALGPNVRWALAASTATVFVCAATLEPPHARAYLMGLALTAARLLDRRPGPVHAAALSALLLLAANPRALFMPGFQLTYLAILAILIAIPRWGANPLSFVLVVQSALIPPFAEFFGVISVAGLLTNLICVPASVPLTALGFGAWGVSHLPGGLETPAVRVLERAAGCFAGLCAWAASRSWAVVPVSPFSPLQWGAYYAGLAGLFLIPHRRGLAVLPVLAAIVFYWAGRAPETGFAAEFRRRFEEEPARRSVLRAGALSVAFTPWGAVVGLGGKDVYCVRTAPSEKDLLRCPMRRTFSALREGAIRLNFDGREIQIQNARTGDPLGGFVP